MEIDSSLGALLFLIGLNMFVMLIVFFLFSIIRRCRGDKQKVKFTDKTLEKMKIKNSNEINTPLLQPNQSKLKFIEKL